MRVQQLSDLGLIVVLFTLAGRLPATTALLILLLTGELKV